jgi:hypothetical protein
MPCSAIASLLAATVLALFLAGGQLARPSKREDELEAVATTLTEED